MRKVLRVSLALCGDEDGADASVAGNEACEASSRSGISFSSRVGSSSNTLASSGTSMGKRLKSSTTVDPALWSA